MTYSVNKFDNIDLKLKAPRRCYPSLSSIKPDVVSKYHQMALNDLGATDDKGRELKEDGLPGKLTEQALVKFQEACGIPVTKVFDDVTNFQIDWRVYGEINGNWSPCSTSITNTKDGGPAIVNGMNEILWPKTPVNIRGLTREALRHSDVREAYLERSLGFEGAVKRARRGGDETLYDASDHWSGTADDDSGDKNKDRKISFEEIEEQYILLNYILQRAFRGPGITPNKVTLRKGNLQISKDRTWRGMDMTAVIVIGNLRRSNGNYIIPAMNPRKDTSWTGKRGAWKQLTGTVHTAPFHAHYTVALGAPYGSPF